HQCPGPLGKLEAVQQLVAGQRRVAADHVTQVQLAELVVGQVERPEAGALERAGDLRGLSRARDLDTDEDVRLRRVGDPVVELGDVARADGDRKSTRLNSSHVKISYAVFC